MDILAAFDDLTAAVVSVWSWAAAVGLSMFLIAWNSGRNPQSAAFFVFSIIPTILTVSFSRAIFFGSGIGGPNAIGTAQIAMLGVAVVLLTACCLMSAWSLVTRTPLASLRGASVLLILGYMPTVAILCVWSIMVVVLRMIGF